MSFFKKKKMSTRYPGGYLELRITDLSKRERQRERKEDKKMEDSEW